MKLYLVEGTTCGGYTTSKHLLYVLADDAGQAESFARSKWEEWKYPYKPTKIELIAENKQYCCANNVHSLVLTPNF